MAHDEMHTLFGRNIFEGSVCDSTEGRRLDAKGEIKNVQWCEGEKFGVRLLYDSDLSRMVGIFFRQF